jgi:hypothetical protein
VACQQTPFENIEGALEYVTCLLDACRVAQTQVEVEIGSVTEGRPSRKLDALKLVDYKLQRLASHLVKSELLLKDLRRLRRIILDERHSVAKTASA